MKKKIWNSLNTQILFTLLAFTIMVSLSYSFMSSTVRRHLAKNAESVLLNTQYEVMKELHDTEMLIDNFSQNIRLMLLRGSTAEEIQNYTNIISNYAYIGEIDKNPLCELYGYYENVWDEPLFIDGLEWIPDDDFIPSERTWYINAVNAKGEIAESAVYIDASSGDSIITFSRGIFDGNGVLLAVVAVDKKIEIIGEIVVKTALNDGGYGTLISQDMITLAHENPEFIGMEISNPQIPISIYADELSLGKELTARSLKNWRGEEVVGFSKIIKNGWHLVLLSPKDQYYAGITRMLYILSGIGLILALALIWTLYQIDKQKKQADAESKQKSAFLANMSHEIRTPINAIVGMTIIGKSADNTVKKNYCFNKISNASHHLMGVINDILDMSKIESGKLELSLGEFNFEKMLRRVVEIAGVRADEKHQKFSVYMDDSIPHTLIGDD